MTSSTAERPGLEDPYEHDERMVDEIAALDAAATSDELAAEQRVDVQLDNLAEPTAAQPQLVLAAENAGTIFADFQLPLYRFALRLLGGHEDAEDAVNQAFEQAYRSLSGGKAIEKPGPWMYRIVSNVAVSALRGRQGRGQILLSMPVSPESEETLADTLVDPDSDQRFELIGDMEIAALALRGLTTGRRTAVVLHDRDGFSMKEVAEALGIQEASARKLASQGRQEAQRIGRELLHGPRPRAW